MGFLSPQSNERFNSNRGELGLPSHSGMSRELRKELDNALARDAARARVVEERINNLARVTRTALVATAAVSSFAEVVAMQAPHARHRTDAIADAMAMGSLQAMNDLASG